MPQDALPSSISCATYSCNSQLIYASFTDGNLGVFDADTLRLRCRIAPSAYLSPTSPNRYSINLLNVSELLVPCHCLFLVYLSCDVSPFPCCRPPGKKTDLRENFYFFSSLQMNCFCCLVYQIYCYAVNLIVYTNANI